MCRFSSALLAVSIIGACSGKGEATAVSTSSNPEPAPPSDELLRELESAALESFSQLSLGSLGAYTDGMRSDRPVVLLGARLGDTYVGDVGGSEDVDRRPLADLYPQLLSKNLDIHVSSTGAVGWMFDELSYRVPVEGRWASVPIRFTAVFTRDVDRWVLAMDHWSYPRPTAEIAEAAVPVDELAGDRHGSGTNALITLVGRLENGDTRARALGRSLDDRAVLLLPGAEAEFHGADIASAPTLLELFGARGTVGLRDFRIEAARSGDVAWMAANLVVSRQRAPELLLRATYVFVHGERGWQVVSEHVSAPVPEGFFEKLLFGEAEPLD